MPRTHRCVIPIGWPLAALLSIVVTAGCESGATPAGTSSSDAKQSGGRYTVVTTTGMVNDIVQQVAGDRAEVTGIMGTGVDPHLYKPTASDNSKLRSADVIFYSGLLLEGRMDEVLKTAHERGKPVYAVTEGIDPDYIRHPPGFAGHPDPHVWGDVTAWSAAAGFVAEKLAEFDPPHADEYRQDAERYRAELAELDAYVRQVIASIPEGQRHLVTAHDAFEYFSHAYGIPVQSVLGITTESEAGVDDINQLVDFLVENKVPAVFIESSVNSRNIEAVIEGAAQRGWSVRIGGELFSDAMGAPGTYEGTYIGMIDHNATVIARALGGEAPERGLRGKLALIAEQSR
jgi:manganese/zinc/iron transport system substrate-binding protein